jgi:dihydroorotate dehydrogenase electron transfer subunit
MVFLAEWMRAQVVAKTATWKPLALMGSEIPFPFKTRPSTILVPGIPAGTIGAHPLLDSWGVPSRLASKAGIAGCYDGFVTQLADEWLGSLDAAYKAEVAIFSCGPTPMLEAVAKVAAKHSVPCQVSLEEFMACAVGGCAGCTVKVATPDGPAMKRVCVDGPVFDSRAVFG